MICMPEEPSVWGGVVRWVMGLFLALVVYVLGLGPAVKYADRLPGNTFEHAYAPILWMVIHSRWADRVAWWYVVDVWHVPMMRD